LWCGDRVPVCGGSDLGKRRASRQLTLHDHLMMSQLIMFGHRPRSSGHILILCANLARFGGLLRLAPPEHACRMLLSKITVSALERTPFGSGSASP
jgi:hypothetical protein